MRARLPFAAVLFVGLAFQARADDPKNAADLKAMTGTWKTTKAELGGADLTAVLKAATLEIRDGGKYALSLGKGKGADDEGTITVDATKSPKEMNIVSTAGANKGKTFKCVYKLDGDSLTVCYNLDTDKGARPDKFESPAGTKVLLVTYARDKK